MKRVLSHCKMVKRGLTALYAIEKRFFLYLALAALAAPLPSYINVYCLAGIVNELAVDRRPGNIVWYAALGLCLNLILRLLSALLNHLKGYHQNQFYKNEKMFFAEKIMALDYALIENSEVYYLREKIKSQSQSGYNMFYLYTFSGKIISDITGIAASLFLAAPLLPASASGVSVKLFFPAAVILTVVINHICNKKNNALMFKMYEDFVPHNARFNFYSDYFDDYNAGKDIRLYGMEGMIEEEVSAQDALQTGIVRKARNKMARYTVFSGVFGSLVTAGVYVFAVVMCINGDMLIGDIAKAAACTGLLISNISAIAADIQGLFNNNKYLKTYFEFLDMPEAAGGGGNRIPRLPQAYELRFENVSFRYPGSEQYALKNVNLTLVSGKRYAVVGENGGGKTTLVKLLCRLYDAGEGTIFLNGVDIREYDKAAYWKLLDAVFQDFTLFAFSLGQNVAAADRYDTDRARRAAEKAGLGDRLASMPDGLETMLYRDFDSGGVELSGGEAQKTAVARAFYRDAEMLVLDEPTAALDPVAEAGVYEKLDKAVNKSLTIFISHRLSSCAFCDEIAVFHRGELVQQGTHEELLRRGGKYAELWNAQAQFYQ